MSSHCEVQEAVSSGSSPVGSSRTGDSSIAGNSIEKTFDVEKIAKEQQDEDPAIKENTGEDGEIIDWDGPDEYVTATLTKSSFANPARSLLTSRVG